MAGVVADRVIVELEAKLDRYAADVRRAEQKFDSASRNIQRSAKQMEKQVLMSSTAIGSSLRGLAGSFAAVFTVQKIIELADGYTRFTNQLKLAGKEGEGLARVQGQLFDIAQKYGAPLENLGTLYGRLAQTQKELGASNAQLLQFTNGVAAALKIQGGSAESTQGALLQLSQALGGAIVRAEEFNSINEGARPILQAVANGITKYGGSVARLRADVIKGKVTSQEFFQGFLKGSAALEAQAAKANLTIGASFTILNNALGKFIGESDQSLSATERFSQAIIALSENLGTVAAAIGLISALLLGRFVAAMVATAASTGLASAAIFAMQARAIGAATTMEALAFAGAAAGRTLLAAFGGPIGLAVAALSVGIYYLATSTHEAAKASGIYAEQQAALKKIQEKTTDATDRLATATGKARAEALANAQALRQETIQYLANARAALIAARAKAVTAQNRYNAEKAAATAAPAVGVGSGGVPGFGLSPSVAVAAGNRDQADANLKAANENVVNAQKELDRLDAIIKAPPPVVVATPSTGHKPKRGPKPKDPDDIAKRFIDDLERGMMDLQQAQTDAIGTTEARQKFELDRIESDRLAQVRAINADKDYSKAQKLQLLELNDEVAQARVAAVLADARVQAADDALFLQQGDIENERDLLEAQGRIADTVAERRTIELRLLDLQYKEEKLRLEAIANNERLNAAERESARRKLAILDQRYALDKQNVERQNEGVGRRYARDLNAKDITEQLDQVRVNGLQKLEDQLTDTISSVFKLGGAFGDVANQIIADLIRIGVQRAIIAPLANMLFGPDPNAPGGGEGGGGGLGGLLGSLFGGGGGGTSGLKGLLSGAKNSIVAGDSWLEKVFGSIGGGGSKGGGGGFSDILGLVGGLFGRASGGHVVAGNVYRVNETGIEGFRPAGSGQIVPLGRMEGRGGNVTQVRQTFVLDARYGVTTPELLRHVNVVASRKAAEAGVTAFRAAQDATPGRVQQYDKMGT